MSANANIGGVKGHKRFRSGAWRLTVFAGWDPVTTKRIDIHETIKAPNNRAGAKEADARLAAIITAVEEGTELKSAPARRGGMTVEELAERWQQTNRPRRNDRTGEWIGWSPKTAKTHADNFRSYILPTLGDRDTASITGLQLDDLYGSLEGRGLSASVVAPCHSQLRAMFGWALRKKLLAANPALAADPPKMKPSVVRVPTMAELRSIQALTPPAFATYIQMAATIGARRGTMLALRWGNVDLDAKQVTFERAIAEGQDGTVEKGTKADRPYVVTLGRSSTEALVEHRRRCIEAAPVVGAEFGPRSFVFSDDGGSTHWNLSWPSHAWKRYATKAGMTQVRLHDPRHAAASQMLMAGVPLSIRSSLSASAAPRPTSCAPTGTSSLGPTATRPSSWTGLRRGRVMRGDVAPLESLEE